MNEKFLHSLLLEIPSSYIKRTKTVFIDGLWRSGNMTDTLPVVDPTSGAIFTRFAPAVLADVEAAANAATNAFQGWRAKSGGERAVYLRGFALGLRSRKAHLIALQMLNNGKPRVEAEVDVDDAASTFEYYAQLAEAFDNRQGCNVDLADAAFHGSTHFEPLGPVALIVPWNFPLVTTAWKLAPALAAGCTAVLKPSEYTTLAELIYGDIALDIEMPSGVLNIVPGDSRIGIALCQNSKFRKISFTGSNTTGCHVMAAAAQRNVPVSLELGGKSPIIILDDADIDQAVKIACAGIFYNCGQMCSATSRLMVASNIAEDFVTALRTRVANLEVGGYDSTSAEMGPLTTAAQRDKVNYFIKKAQADGLNCIAGGKISNAMNGFFVEPTIYIETPRDHAIWREEIFGPILSINSFSSNEAAIELANDSKFALAATVVGNDKERASRVASLIDAGHVWINTPQLIFPNTAWGGFKSSGIGRELGPWGMAAYYSIKHITRLA